MRTVTLTLVLLLLVPIAASAQDREVTSWREPYISVPSPLVSKAPFLAVLHDNGPLVNCPGCGAGGADESQLQTALGMNILGFGHQVSAGNRVADDFTISDPSGWDIDTITFYAYQTGSSTTSTITAVNLQIWNGLPGGGGTVIFGDTSTNLMTGTTWSNIYRATDTSSGSTARPIMADTVTISPALHLDPGQYWLDWQSDGTLASGPWAPPVTINGQTTTGDGLQSLDNGITWAPVVDVGGQAFPFIIEGAVTGGCVAIPDDGYDGTLGSMACMTVPGDPVTIDDLDVVLGIDHTFVGDLVIKVVNPANEVLTLMSRPGFAEPADDGTGGFGNCADIFSAFPVTFDDSSLNDAEAMGASGLDVCAVDGICDYFPNPGAGPGTNLAQFDGQDATGDWMVCVGDAAGADTGELCDAQLLFTPGGLPFADGFESGDTSAWSSTVP